MATGSPRGARREPAAAGAETSTDEGQWVDPFAQALAVLAMTPHVLPSLVRAIEPAVLERDPAPGEWAPRAILGHLLYVEGLLQDRIRQMAESQGEIPMPAGPPAPEPYPIELGLERWLTARQTSLSWLRSLGPEQLDRVGVHRRYGRITVREHVVEWAYHDLEHLRQMAAAVEAALYPSIGGWQSLYPPPFPSGGE